MRPVRFLHVIDIVPTLYEAAGITPPDILNGVQQKPLKGVSFLKTFTDANAPPTPGRRSTLNCS